MNKIDVLVLSITLIIIVAYIVSRILNKKEHFSGLYNYNLVDLKEDHGIGMFGGDNEVKVYDIELAPIVGPAGVQQAAGKRDESIPTVGFSPNEVRKIPNFERAIKKKNNIEYVDNNLMVPLLYHVLKRVTILFDSLQSQITDCCHK